MNSVKQRFKSEEEKKEYNSSRPITHEQEQKVVNQAEQNCFKILNAYTSLEYSLTKLVLHGIGLDENQTVWKLNHGEYRQTMAKIFSIHDIRGMIKQLIKEGVLIENDSSKNIKLPTSFKTTETVNYLEAIEIAFGYRNTLAHEGYIMYYPKVSGQFKMWPFIEAKKYQTEKGYPSVGILEQTIIEKGTGKELKLSFMDFLGRLTLGLPPHGITEMRYQKATPPNAADFVEKRINKAKKAMESMLKSKIKKIEKFAERINNDYE